MKWKYPYGIAVRNAREALWNFGDEPDETESARKGRQTRKGVMVLAELTVLRFWELLPVILAAGWVVVARQGDNRLFRRGDERLLLPFSDDRVLTSGEMEWLIRRFHLSP